MDDVRRSVDLWETSSLNNWDLVTIFDGGVYEGTLVFEIPEKHDSIELDYSRLSSDYNIVWIENEG